MLAATTDLPDAVPVARADRVGRADVRDRRRLPDGLDAVLLRRGPAGLGRRDARAVRRSRRARRGGQRPARRPAAARAHARRGARAVGHELAWPQVGRQTAAVLREAIALGPPRTCARARRRRRCRARATLAPADAGRRRRDRPARRRHRPACAPPATASTTSRGWRSSRSGCAQTTGTETYHRMLARSLGFLRHAWSARRRAACTTSCPTTAAGSTSRTAATTSGAPRGRSARSWRAEPAPALREPSRDPAARDAAGARRAALAADDGLRRARPRPRRPGRRRPGRRRGPARPRRSGSPTSSARTRRRTGTGPRTS